MSEVKNIYTKLQDMRVALQGLNIKKSGHNKHLNYYYYELGDFMPPINQLMKEHGVCSVITFLPDMATLVLVNAENPQETIVFTSPMAEAKLGSAHPIQNLGAVETYQRRYLYMTAFEIVEADVLDGTQGSENGAQNRGGNQRGSNPSGYRNGNQRGNSGQQQRPRQNTGLPKDLSDQLNAAISSASGFTGEPIPQIVAELERITGIKMQAVTVNNAQVILDAIDDITGANTPLPWDAE